MNLESKRILFTGLAVVWSLIWKGLALWKSAEKKQKIWFIAILVINTLGLLEIIYLLWTKRQEKKIAPEGV